VGGARSREGNSKKTDTHVGGARQKTSLCEGAKKKKNQGRPEFGGCGTGNKKRNSSRTTSWIEQGERNDGEEVCALGKKCAEGRGGVSPGAQVKLGSEGREKTHLLRLLVSSIQEGARSPRDSCGKKRKKNPQLPTFVGTKSPPSSPERWTRRDCLAALKKKIKTQQRQREGKEKKISSAPPKRSICSVQKRGKNGRTGSCWLPEKEHHQGRDSGRKDWGRRARRRDATMTSRGKKTAARTSWVGSRRNEKRSELREIANRKKRKKKRGRERACSQYDYTNRNINGSSGKKEEGKRPEGLEVWGSHPGKGDARKPSDLKRPEEWGKGVSTVCRGWGDQKRKKAPARNPQGYCGGRRKRTVGRGVVTGRIREGGERLRDDSTSALLGWGDHGKRAVAQLGGCRKKPGNPCRGGIRGPDSNPSSVRA